MADYLGRQIVITPRPLRVVQRSDTKESFAPGVKRTYGLMELVRGTCPTVDKGPYNFVFTWPHLLEQRWWHFFDAGISFRHYPLLMPPLEEPANPSKAYKSIKSSLVFSWIQEMVAYNAFWGGVAIPMGIVLGLMAIPYLDRNPHGKGIGFIEAVI